MNQPKNPTAQPQPAPERDRPLPADDPGGAHAKGYSADPRPDADVPEQDPIPLQPSPAATSQVHQPEKEGKAQPTGREDRGAEAPNQRVMGADR
jgi:hypothetical protein